MKVGGLPAASYLLMKVRLLSQLVEVREQQEFCGLCLGAVSWAGRLHTEEVHGKARRPKSTTLLRRDCGQWVCLGRRRTSAGCSRAVSMDRPL